MFHEKLKKGKLSNLSKIVVYERLSRKNIEEDTEEKGLDYIWKRISNGEFFSVY